MIPKSRMTDEEKQIVEVLKDVRHCGDYGQIWWNAKQHCVWLTLGDGDGDLDQGHSDFRVIERDVLALPFVRTFAIEAESHPADESEFDRAPDWKEVIAEEEGLTPEEMDVPESEFGYDWVCLGVAGRPVNEYDTLPIRWQEVIHFSCLAPSYYEWKYSKDPVLNEAYERLKEASKVAHEVVELIRPMVKAKR